MIEKVCFVLELELMFINNLKITFQRPSQFRVQDAYSEKYTLNLRYADFIRCIILIVLTSGWTIALSLWPSRRKLIME